MDQAPTQTNVDIDAAISNDPVLNAIIKGPINQAQTVQQVAQVATERNAAMNAQIQANAQQVQKVQAERGEAIGALFSQKEIIERQAAKANYDTQNYVRGVAEKSGAIGNAEVMSALAGNLRDATIRQTQTSAALTKASSSSLFDNPFQWLFDQIELPQLQRQAEATSAEVRNARAAFEAQQSAVTAAETIAKKTAEVVTPEVYEAQLKAITADLTVQRDKAVMENIGYGTQALAQAITANNGVLNSVESARRMALTEQEAARSAQRHEWARKESEIKLKEAETSRDAQAIVYDAVNRGLAIADPDARPLSASEIMALKVADERRFKELMERGMVHIGTSTPGKYDGVRSFGATPAEAAYFALTTKANVKSPLIKDLSEKFREHITTYMRDNPSAKEEVAIKEAAKAMNAKYASLSAEWKTNAETTDSQYAAPDIKTVLKFIPGAASNPFYAHLATFADKPGTTEVIRAAAVERIKANPQDFEKVAQDVAGFYRTVAAYNSQTKNFRGVGLPDQVNYVVSKTDYTDLSAVRYELLKTTVTPAIAPYLNPMNNQLSKTLRGSVSDYTKALRGE